MTKAYKLSENIIDDIGEALGRVEEDLPAEVVERFQQAETDIEESYEEGTEQLSESLGDEIISMMEPSLQKTLENITGSMESVRELLDNSEGKDLEEKFRNHVTYSSRGFVGSQMKKGYAAAAVIIRESGVDDDTIEGKTPMQLLDAAVSGEFDVPADVLQNALSEVTNSVTDLEEYSDNPVISASTERIKDRYSLEDSKPVEKFTDEQDSITRFDTAISTLSDEVESLQEEHERNEERLGGWRRPVNAVIRGLRRFSFLRERLPDFEAEADEALDNLNETQEALLEAEQARDSARNKLDKLISHANTVAENESRGGPERSSSEYSSFLEEQRKLGLYAKKGVEIPQDVSLEDLPPEKVVTKIEALARGTYIDNCSQESELQALEGFREKAIRFYGAPYYEDNNWQRVYATTEEQKEEESRRHREEREKIVKRFDRRTTEFVAEVSAYWVVGKEVAQQLEVAIDEEAMASALEYGTKFWEANSQSMYHHPEGTEGKAVHAFVEEVSGIKTESLRYPMSQYACAAYYLDRLSREHDIPVGKEMVPYITAFMGGASLNPNHELNQEFRALLADVMDFQDTDGTKPQKRMGSQLVTKADEAEWLGTRISNIVDFDWGRKQIPMETWEDLDRIEIATRQLREQIRGSCFDFRNNFGEEYPQVVENQDRILSPFNRGETNYKDLGGRYIKRDERTYEYTKTLNELFEE